MRRVELDFFGPFGSGSDKTIPSIYAEANKRVTAKCGVYLWTVLTPDGDELVYYVGETGRSFVERIEEEIVDISSGKSRVYDPERFIRGQKTLLWGGRFARHRETGADRMLYFRQLKPVVTHFLEIQRLHLAPVSSDQAGIMSENEFRIRLEAGFADHFYHQAGVVGRFQDDDTRYSTASGSGMLRLEELDWRPADATTLVICHTKADIRGFPREIVV